MNTIAEIYSLLGSREQDKTLQAYNLALKEFGRDDGPELLAAHEAVVHILDGFLLELAEHGTANENAWTFARTEVDLQRMVEAHRRSVEESKRLRDKWINHKELTGSYMSDWIIPIGSRDWIVGQRQIAKHRDNDWIAKTQSVLAEVDE